MRTQADDIRDQIEFLEYDLKLVNPELSQADDIRDQIEFLEYDLKLVNPELCPRYYKGLINEIMDLKSILINIQ